MRIQIAEAPYNSYNLNTGNSTSNKLTFFLFNWQQMIYLFKTLLQQLQMFGTMQQITCDYNNTKTALPQELYLNGTLVAQTK